MKGIKGGVNKPIRRIRSACFSQTLCTFDMTRSDDLQFAKLDCNSVDINELFSTDKFELSVYPFD